MPTRSTRQANAATSCHVSKSMLKESSLCSCSLRCKRSSIYLRPSAPKSSRSLTICQPWRISSAMIRASIHRSSNVGALSSQGRCCWTDANSVSACTHSSLIRKSRYSSGSSWACSNFRTPFISPHWMSRVCIDWCRSFAKFGASRRSRRPLASQSRAIRPQFSYEFFHEHDLAGLGPAGDLAKRSRVPYCEPEDQIAVLGDLEQDVGGDGVAYAARREMLQHDLEPNARVPILEILVGQHIGRVLDELQQARRREHGRQFPAAGKGGRVLRRDCQLCLSPQANRPREIRNGSHVAHLASLSLHNKRTAFARKGRRRFSPGPQALREHSSRPTAGRWRANTRRCGHRSTA